MGFLGAASALVLAFGVGANKAHAVGAPAGTVINSTAEVTYTIGSVNTTASSNLVSVTVVEILDVTVAAQTANIAVSPGATTQVARYRVENTGNGPETFRLVLNNAITTDNFDPIAATPAIYLDSGGGAATNGIFDGSDIPYVAGSNDPALPRDTFAIVFVVNDIPATALDSQVGITRLIAESRTGTGVAGTTFAGQGNGLNGAVDAVVGTSGADGEADSNYNVSGVSMSATKTQSVVDNWGGARPVPGARINYSIAVNVTGSGTANNAVFTDNIPANTTYVPGTLALNSVALTDAVDAADDGDFAAAAGPNPARVRVALGPLNTASGTKTITFTVTIN
ncbi:MAG TPA: hypothetical protein VFU13_04375 [Steroidobacteraceae bacterium]|nr:hypothetical protein [Steroidobacteraceae bacterium]